MAYCSSSGRSGSMTGLSMWKPVWNGLPFVISGSRINFVCLSNAILLVNLWQAIQQQTKSTDWAKLDPLEDLQWPAMPNWSPVFEYGQQPGDLSRGPAALLTAPAFAFGPTHLFVCFPAFVWTIDFLCKHKETRAFQRRNPLPSCLRTPQCGFIFSLFGE